MKHYRFLRPLCGAVLFFISAAAAAEVCFENLDEIVLEDPNTGDQVPYPVPPGGIPCTVDDAGSKQLMIEFELQGLALNIPSVVVGPTDATNAGSPVPVGLGATPNVDVTVVSFPVPVDSVTVTADPATPGNPGDDINCGTANVNTSADEFPDVVFTCALDPVNGEILPGTITASGSGLGRNQSFYIQPDALIVEPADQTVVTSIGDPGVVVPVTVRSVNGTTIPGVDVTDSRGGGLCAPTGQTITGTPFAFSCNVEELGGATPENGTLTASDGGTNALDGTAGYTLEPLGLVITGVSPSSQIVNIGDTGDITVSVRSNGGTISGVSVADSRGGSCSPVGGTTVDDVSDTDWDCTVGALPNGNPANGTLTASASGATSDNDNYTLNPTQLTVTLNEPACANPAENMTLGVLISHNGPGTVSDVDVTVTNPSTVCDVNLNVPAGTSVPADCTFTPSAFPVSGSVSTSNTNANDDSDSYNIAQCQGQLPAYCNTAEHNAILASGNGATSIADQPGFWNNGAWWDTPGSTETAFLQRGRIWALPFTPGNGSSGNIAFTGPGANWRVALSDCPGDFSDQRPFQSPNPNAPDTALGSNPAGFPLCVTLGSTAFDLDWAAPSGGSAPVCYLLQPGTTYYLNVGAIEDDGSGGWNSTCASNCSLNFDQN